MNCTKIHDPIVFILEPFIGGLFFNLLGAYALANVLGVSYWSGLILAMMLRYGGEWILYPLCGWTMTFTTPLAWLARDVLQPLFMLTALFTREVDWRGETLDMRR